MKTLAVVFISLVILSFVSCSRDANDWKLIRAARAEEPVTFHVALHQRNIDLLEKHLYQISDPSHPRYGEEMSRDEIMDLIAPPKEDHDAVVDWFKSHGALEVHSFGDALKVTALSHSVEKMLKTRLYKYQHIERTDIHAIRHVGGFTIPSEIEDKIYMVTGLTMFPYVSKNSNQQADILAQAKRSKYPYYPFVSISNVRSLYNVPVGTAAQTNQITQVPIEFSPTTAPDDVDIRQFAFMSEEVYNPLSKTVGPFKTDKPSFALESTVDAELMMGLGTNITNWFYTVTLGWVWEMSLELFNLKQAPQVVSISYSYPEGRSCDSSTGVYCGSLSVAQWVNRTNIEFMKNRSTPLLTTAGNQGASDQSSNCNTQINPVFPASSPYVTVVGSTTLAPATSTDRQSAKRNVAQDSNDIPICLNGLDCVSGPVVEWPSMANISQFTTGGGFSLFAKTPSYQASFVQQYLNSPNVMLPPPQYFNATSRGYPDISLVGDRILAIHSGGLFGTGFSASTPLAAAMISLLNDARAQNNKTPLGFLNPLLYQMYKDSPETFNDITVGDNHWGWDVSCEYGYGATKGWDAITGLGTPNFGAISKYIAKLP